LGGVLLAFDFNKFFHQLIVVVLQKINFLPHLVENEL
jgi:hypothetical protein